LQLGFDVLGTLAVNFVRIEAVQELLWGYKVTFRPAKFCIDIMQHNNAREVAA
jgi:hypothetical protein